MACSIATCSSVSSWLEDTDWPGAWQSLDEYDDDLVLFLTYFIAAVQTVFPEAGQKTWALLKAPSLPLAPVLARNLSTNWTRLRPPLCWCWTTIT